MSKTQPLIWPSALSFTPHSPVFLPSLVSSHPILLIATAKVATAKLSAKNFGVLLMFFFLWIPHIQSQQILLPVPAKHTQNLFLITSSAITLVWAIISSSHLDFYTVSHNWFLYSALLLWWSISTQQLEWFLYFYFLNLCLKLFLKFIYFWLFWVSVAAWAFL